MQKEPMCIKPENKISIILPCLNEELGIGHCIEKIHSVCPFGEILVIDNGSNDRSVHIAETMGARVIREEIVGYGAACRKGFTSAQGSIIILSDADNSYSLTDIPAFVNKLQNTDMVVGERVIQNWNTMPLTHRLCGNPFFSVLLRTFFHVPARDTQSGFVALKKEALKKLTLKSTGMEFISELYITATRAGLSFVSYPTIYKRRLGHSKLRTIRDGIRHLRLISAQALRSYAYRYLS